MAGRLSLEAMSLSAFPLRSRPLHPFKRKAARAGGRGARRLQGGRFFESVRLLGRGKWRGSLRARHPLRPGFALGLESRLRTAGSGVQGNMFQSLGKSADFPLSALRAVRKERHPEMPFARSRPGLRPSGGFVAHLAFDHQMTPALFRPLFRASPSRGLHWRIGCRARLRRPSDLKHLAACREGCGLEASFEPRPPDAVLLAHHAVPDCGEGEVERWAGLRLAPIELRAEQRLAPLVRWATGIACTAGLKHLAACREGNGLGSSFEPRPPSAD